MHCALSRNVLKFYRIVKSFDLLEPLVESDQLAIEGGGQPLLVSTSRHLFFLLVKSFFLLVRNSSSTVNATYSGFGLPASFSSLLQIAQDDRRGLELYCFTTAWHIFAHCKWWVHMIIYDQRETGSLTHRLLFYKKAELILDGKV